LLAWIRAKESEEGFAQAPFCQERARRDLKHGAFYAVGQVLPARHAAKLQGAKAVAHCVDQDLAGERGLGDRRERLPKASRANEGCSCTVVTCAPDQGSQQHEVHPRLPEVHASPLLVRAQHRVVMRRERQGSGEDLNLMVCDPPGREDQRVGKLEHARKQQLSPVMITAGHATRARGPSSEKGVAITMSHDQQLPQRGDRNYQAGARN